MKITYDEEADAAYVALDEMIKPGEAVEQVSLLETPNGQTQITIDVDKDGYLLGFEILAASAGLRPEILLTTERL